MSVSSASRDGYPQDIQEPVIDASWNIAFDDDANDYANKLYRSCIASALRSENKDDVVRVKETIKTNPFLRHYFS